MTFLVLCSVGLLATIGASLRWRLQHGASWQELWESRFHELLPIRSLIRLVLVLLLEVTILGGMAILNAYQIHDKAGSDASGTIFIAPILVTLAAGASTFFWWSGVTRSPVGFQVPVNIEKAEIGSVIERSRLTALGSERYPNHIAPQREADTNIRIAVLAAAVIGMGTLGYQYYQGNLCGAYQPPVLPQAHREIVGFIGWACLALGLLSLLNNRDYTLVRFRPALVAQVGLSIGLVGTVAFLASTIDLVAKVGFAALLTLAWRMGRDLKRQVGFYAEKRVTDPIAATLRRLMPYLPEIGQHPDLRLPDLNKKHLGEWITRGCVNVERKQFLVLRTFARFMRLLRIEQEHFTVGALRYLTVGRSVSVGGGYGTSEYCRHPVVPKWDLDQFPLYPPEERENDAGFRDENDSLGLPWMWDIVQICGPCGGQGWVWETVYYYETEYYTESYTDSNGNYQTRQCSRDVQKSKQEKKTCSTCSGHGRTRHTQFLNTHWRYVSPRLTDPEIPLPELADNAEERTYLKLWLTRDLNDTPFEPELSIPSCDLSARMEQTAADVARLHPTHSAQILELTQGRYVYQADFQIAGFRTIRILFENLRGSEGWFFGKRPEFYFPKLPLCWATVASIVLIPPIALSLMAVLWMAGQQWIK